MLSFKVFQVLLICLVLRSLLVFSQPRIVLLFCTIGLTFTSLAFIRWQDLPSLTNDLSNLSEG
jgi:hypothetical protein